MMRDEGTVVKIKKRKIDLVLASELKIMKEIVMRLPQRSGESSSKPVSQVLQYESYSYLRDQRKQKAQVDKLEKAYIGLAKSQGELSLSHRNIKKREKM
ncbi:hypothetical protein H5410_015307 [Solanum commersonii]|uniref:Uncharacterized protein n=1 Tax=Solanum commersonii TaxID=4109 RepID=A0A9J5ZTQ8_SOLCO|nr:hypothetical protein H5410_015307 [Solanum commersonii]